MTELPVFGKITTVPAIEQAVLATLKLWSPRYLRAMEASTGREPGALPEIASWRPTDDLADRFPEQMIPAVQLQCTTDIDLDVKGDVVVAGLRGTIDVVVQSNEPEPARELASLYAFLLGLIVLQKPELDGSIKCLGTGWEKLGVPDVGKLKAEARWLAFGSATILLAVSDFASPLMAPESPELDADEVAEYPEVTSHKLTLDPEA
jgi:hypothetical protein